MFPCFQREGTRAIKFRFLSSEDYSNAASFLTEACKDIELAQVTMKLHTILPHAAYNFWVIDTSYFADC